MSVRKHLSYGLRYLLRDNVFGSAKLHVLQGHDKWHAMELESLRNKMLLNTLLTAQKRLMRYARIDAAIPSAEVVPFLKEHYPIIDKTELLSHRELYYPYRGRGLPWTIRGKTSGTTGTPLEIWRSVDSVLWETAFIKRHWSWSGFRDGMKRATLRGDDVVPLHQDRPPFWLYNRFNNQLLVSSRHLKPPYMGYITETLQTFQPYLLQAYPSTAFALAEYLERIDASLRIPYVFTGSEILHAYQRELIETRIGKVMDFYGMAERVAFASECEQGNLHLNSDYSFVEIVDEAGEETGGEGYVVGTTFHNQLMPLVRYRVSDRTKWKRGVCSCGRHYPMIEMIAGKFEDTINGSDGNPISPSLVTFAFKGVHNIASSQVAQIGAGIWEVRIVPAPGYKDEDGRQVVRNIHALVDRDIRLTIAIVPDIPRTRAGKYRWVVNECGDTRKSTPNSNGVSTESAYSPRSVDAE